jgi:superfamily II DNA or RNA helicase
MKLREHQKNCLNNIDNHFKTENNGLIKMFCGSGKSFIIYNCLLKYGNNLSVVVVPSINLITQFNRDYLLDDNKQKYNNNHFKKKFKLLTVCSKNEISLNLQNEFSFSTDENEILKFLQKKIDKIVLITYQSLKLLFNIIKCNKLEINLLCFDEAHHILGDEMKKLLFGTDENYSDYYPDDSSDNNSDDSSDDDSDLNSDISLNENFIETFVNKTLYFTATPKNSNGIKMYESINDITLDNQEYEIINDEDTFYQDDCHCGKLIYEYMHTDGVNDNILNDFNIRVDLYTENKDKSIFEAISRTILETGNNRILTFHSRSETKSDNGSDVSSFSDKMNKKEFIKCFNSIVKLEFPKLKDKYKNIEFKGITGNTKNKMEMLEEFDETSDDSIFVLASCKTIGEGVDTKNANMVVFIDPKQSYVEIIQNIGRICRKNKNTKQLATILIPCYVDVSKYKECKSIEEKDNVIRNEMSKTGNFNGILNVLSALRQEDPYMFELCLKYPEVFTEKEINDNLKKNGLECDKKEYTKDELFIELGEKYNKKKTEKDNFKQLSNKIDKNIQVINNKILDDDIYIDNKSEETMYLVKKDDNTYVKTKGKSKDVVKKCHRNIKPFVHANDEIKVLWNIEGDVSLDKKIFGGYIKSTLVPTNVDNWMEKLDNVKKYIDENNKRPSSHDKNNKIKQMGKWLQYLKENYDKQQNIMKNPEIKIKYENFITTYKKYFMSNEEQWQINLNNVKKYIDENNKRPLSKDKNIVIKQICKWLQHQKTNYDKQKEIMINPEIRIKYENFITTYKKYFMSNEEQWQINLNNVKKYIDENNKKPSSIDKNIVIKQMNKWLQHQNENYKKEKQIMKNPEIRNEYEKFMSEYKEYFPNFQIIKVQPEIKPAKKSTTIKPKEEIKQVELDKSIKRLQSEYQELTKKMSIQKSETTIKMFNDDPSLWNKYHDNRDFSFKGYDNQSEIPINKIISYLETKSNRKLKILDLGCGRNLIKQHFIQNNKFDITGYDYVSFNTSIKCDVSNLPDEDETIDICIFSQSLMGSNWKEYINESIRVLRYNGEMIISESIERYDIIKKYIEELGLHIKSSINKTTNRWFYLHIINDKK